MGLEILLPLMIIVLIVVMFMQSAKQRKAVKEMKEMQASLAPGDRVLTTSGLEATVSAVTEEAVELEIAPGVRTRWDRRVIREKYDPASVQGEAADTSGSRQDSSDQ